MHPESLQFIPGEAQGRYRDSWCMLCCQCGATAYSGILCRAVDAGLLPSTFYGQSPPCAIGGDALNGRALLISLFGVNLFPIWKLIALVRADYQDICLVRCLLAGLLLTWRMVTNLLRYVARY